MSTTPKHRIEFTPGSKVIFVAGGYEGGRQRVGVVLGVTPGNDVLLCMLDDEQVDAPSHIEGYGATWLRAEIAEGRLEGSMKEVRFVPSVNQCQPLVNECQPPSAARQLPVDGGYAVENPGDGDWSDRRYGH